LITYNYLINYRQHQHESSGTWPSHQRTDHEFCAHSLPWKQTDPHSAGFIGRQNHHDHHCHHFPGFFQFWGLF